MTSTGTPYFTDDEQELIDIIQIYKGRDASRLHIVLEDMNVDDDDLDFYAQGECKADPIGVGIVLALKAIPIERRESVIEGYPCDWDLSE